MDRLETYDAVKQAVARLSSEDVYRLHPTDAKQLKKLEPSDLAQRGVERTVAVTVTTALMNDDLGPLSESMGVRLAEAPDAERLQPTS